MPYVTIERSRTWGFPGRNIALYVMTVAARHCVAARMCECNRDDLSRECGAVLRCDREGFVRAID